MDRSELFSQLQNAHARFVGVDTIWWRSYGLFLAANGVLVVALLTALPRGLASAAIAILGALLTAVSYLFQERILAHVKRFEELIERLEGENGLSLPEDFKISLWDSEDYEQMDKETESARLLQRATMAAVGAGWSAIFVWHLF